MALELSNKEYLVKDLNEEISEKKKSINLQNLRISENDITIVEKDETIKKLRAELEKLRPRSLPASEPVAGTYKRRMNPNPPIDDFWKTPEDTEKEFNCKLEELTNPNELWITQARKSQQAPLPANKLGSYRSVPAP